MKKSLVFLAFSLVVMFPLAAMAAVSGPCYDCHTMHYSQGGDVLDDWGTEGPYGALLVNDCFGCHTTDGSVPLVAGYPFVAGNGFDDNNCLAGGFFDRNFFTTPSVDDNSDNFHSLGTRAVPAGYNSNEDPPGDWYTGGADGLGCAGTSGCHGVHEVDDGQGGTRPAADDMESIRGGHHNPSAYRILFAGASGTTPVVGHGAYDYEYGLNSSDNLETYPVETTVGPTQNVNIYSAGENDPSISELCAKCHADFHGSDDTNGTSPWLRHPTDYVIPSTWEIGGSYTLNGRDYKNNPVGYDGAVFGSERRVTCLSCHRAHGTENRDLLRWAYDPNEDPRDVEQVAGGGALYGCLGCHDRQR